MALNVLEGGKNWNQISSTLTILTECWMHDFLMEKQAKEDGSPLPSYNNVEWGEGKPNTIMSKLL